MHRSSVAKIIILIAISGFAFVYLGGYSWYLARSAISSALGEIARAESAQTPNEVIYHITLASDRLPERGAVSWWSPERGDFKTIQAELDDIIIRARNISALDSENELFISEMYGMHARLKGIQEILV